MLRLAIVAGAAVLVGFLLAEKLRVETVSAAQVVADVPVTKAGRVAGPLSLADAVPLADPGPYMPPTPAAFDLTDLSIPDPRSLAVPGMDADGVGDDDNLYRVEAVQLDLHAGPSATYPEIGTVSQGQTVIATGQPTEGWFWVRTRDGALSGYLPAEKLARAE